MSSIKHVAILGSLFKPTTYAASGGVEIWTANFLESFIHKRYTFDLYATEDSLHRPGKINLKAVTKPIDTIVQNHPYFSSYIPHHAQLPHKEYLIDLGVSLSVRIMHELIKNADTYEFVIDNTGWSALSTNWDLFPKPVYIICHFNEIAPHISLFQILPIPKNVFFVFLSQQQSDKASWIPKEKKTVIPHGIPINNFIFSQQSSDALSWIGRITPEKGLEDAIETADAVKKTLIISGKKQDLIFFNTAIQPLLNQMTTLKENDFQSKFHNHTKALLFPTHWEEGFGLVAIEAMACGTPVVAYARSALSKIIQDGITGFLVNPSDTDIRGNFVTKQTGIKGFIEATQKIYSMPQQEYLKMRQTCRDVVAKNYTLQQMIERYDVLFSKNR